MRERERDGRREKERRERGGRSVCQLIKNKLNFGCRYSTIYVDLDGTMT
jgi:hypothetical protein